ncbi:hypothetical protein [Hespellia stercorisuis]|uniref:hypothetical protein n=1 Tax=Hespellia stercorisuis TaxID=180311 RepID=UPI0009330E71|nr:hypothetical protein [Hespellia stercorisuis]
MLWIIDGADASKRISFAASAQALRFRPPAVDILSTISETNHSLYMNTIHEKCREDNKRMLSGGAEHLTADS